MAWDDDDGNDGIERLKAWLPLQTPETWHKVALTWNWDNGIEVLDWILDQSTCDRGTAIAVYRLGQPDYFAEQYLSLEAMRAEDNFQLADAEFLARICERWANGAFGEYRYSPGENWDPEDDSGEGLSAGISGKAPWPVPVLMVAAVIEGEVVDLSGFAEGMPIAWFGRSVGNPVPSWPSLSHR